MSTVPPAASFPGPSELGRGAVVLPGAPTPPGFEDVPRVVIDDAVLADPPATVDLLHRHWLGRHPIVIELAVDNDALRAPESIDLPPHRLPPGFTFHRERLAFLVWANTYDLRAGEPIWWLGVLAERRGRGVTRSAVADVILPDGEHAWCDGGPREPLPLLTVHRETIRDLGRVAPQPRGEAASSSVLADALAPDQLAAVTHRRGPARIIAPAGSGKTRVLTARLRHLIADRGVEPELITAVAYNRRAADEMRERLGATRAEVRTVHSLALSIVRRVEPREVIDEREVRSILERLVTVPRVPNTDPYLPYLEALAEVRLALRDPEEVEEARDDVDGFAAMFPRYRQVLADRGVLDFDEQLYRAIELLVTRPDLRAEVQRSCTHLLVDEFQDLTPAFVLLLRLLAGPPSQLFGVGDDDQVIYSHAGADPDFLLRFDAYAGGIAQTHALEVNYRCPPEVVTAAANLLTHNRRRIDKEIRSGRPNGGDREAGGEPLAIHTVSSTAQAERATALIRRWCDAGTAPTSIAVLTRVNAGLLPIQVALHGVGIPTTAPVDASVLNRTGIRAALAYLRIGLRPDTVRREDLFEVVNRPPRKLSRVLRDVLPRRGKLSLDVLEGVAATLDGKAAERLADLVRDLERLVRSLAEGITTARALWIIRNRIGLGEAMDTLDASGRSSTSSHHDDLDALEQLAVLHDDPATFGAWLRDELSAPGDPKGVTLSTVHRVKGMEWDRVVVFGASAGLFPHRLAEDTEEERRVFHVAITRGREEVAVVGNEAAPSPFIAELAAPASDRHRRAVVAAEPPPVRSSPREPHRPAPTPAVSATAYTEVAPEDRALFEALRNWRSRIAAESAMPAYLVLIDRSLVEIAARRPASVRELATVHGVGPTKIERYGDDLLAIVERHAD